MDEKEFYKILGFVKVSINRTNTLKAINHKIKMPSERAKELNINTSQVSAALKDLKSKNLVICINECKKRQIIQIHPIRH